MIADADLIVCHDEDKNGPLPERHFFYLQDTNTLNSSELLAYVDILEKLVFRIARKPKHLISHLQRIYFCFHKDLNEQLFAAIVDFLVILNRHGQAISWRMLAGIKPGLSNEQFILIKEYLKDEQASPFLLAGNRYCILTRGIVGTNALVRQVVADQAKPDHDPLEIARDHIEYSQLEEAKQVLENALLKHPARVELQHELLALYKSTRDSEGFYTMLNELNRSDFDIIAEWDQLNNFFKGRNNNG